MSRIARYRKKIQREAARPGIARWKSTVQIQRGQDSASLPRYCGRMYKYALRKDPTLTKRRWKEIRKVDIEGRLGRFDIGGQFGPWVAMKPEVREVFAHFILEDPLVASRAYISNE